MTYKSLIECQGAVVVDFEAANNSNTKFTSIFIGTNQVVQLQNRYSQASIY